MCRKFVGGALSAGARVSGLWKGVRTAKHALRPAGAAARSALDLHTLLEILIRGHSRTRPPFPPPLPPLHSLLYYQAVQRNASLYLHTLLAPTGTPLDPSAPGYDAGAIHARTWRANVHLPRPKNKTGVLLLAAGGGKKGDAEASSTPGRVLAGFDGGDGVAAADRASKLPPAPPREIISYLKPNLTVALVDEFSAFPASGVPPHVSSHGKGGGRGVGCGA